MTLRLRGSTSGYAEINAPAVAGDNSLTLPTTAGTIRITNPSGVDGDYTVATGATISGSTNTITASTNGEERLRIDSSGDIEIAQGKNLTWVYEGGSTHRARIRAESTDALIFENGFGNTEQLRITSAGNVGIGTDNPSDALTVYKTNVGNPAGITIRNTETSSTYSHARLRLESQNGAAYGEIWADVANAGLRLGYNSSSTVKIDSTGNIVLLSGKGINFHNYGTGTGVSSNLLDDYEEGTWTPKVTFGGVDATHVTQNGSYVKIGRLVVCYGMISISARGTGGMAVEDLPFQVADLLSGTSLEGGGIFSYQNNVSGVYGPIVILPSQNSFVATVYAATSTSGNMVGVTNNNISSNFDCRFTFSYQTAT